jgi:Methylase involved in ubiquinone/menaquinone biosynthesis
MDARKNFFSSYLKKEDAILELGPLHRPIVEKNQYPNAKYCDIRSTEEVKALYTGNDYLAQTGITIPVDEIVAIDYVVHGNYSECIPNNTFDCIVASHVIEHIPNIISALQDFAKLLKPKGQLCIGYPDMRYCFDHFRVSASFRDAYPVFVGNTDANAYMPLDFFLSAVPENSAYFFWQGKDIESKLPVDFGLKALEAYQKDLAGNVEADVHYWPFTDRTFLQFLYDCTRTGLLPYKCIAFQQTLENDQQFMVVLQKEEKTRKEPVAAMQLLRAHMVQARPYYFTSQDIQHASKLNEQDQLLNQANADLALMQEQNLAQEQLLNQAKADLASVQEQNLAQEQLLNQAKADLASVQEQNLAQEQLLNQARVKSQ